MLSNKQILTGVARLAGAGAILWILGVAARDVTDSFILALAAGAVWALVGPRMPWFGRVRERLGPATWLLFLAWMIAASLGVVGILTAVVVIGLDLLHGWSPFAGQLLFATMGLSLGFFWVSVMRSRRPSEK